MNNQPATTTTSKVPANADDQHEYGSLWITHVTAVGPYLKVCGQLNPMIDLPQRLMQTVLPLCQVMHTTWTTAEKKQKLSMEKIYMVKSTNRITSLGDDELLRARIQRIIETQPPQAILLVEVEFIDMGYSKIIECDEILIAPQDNKLMKMPALGSQFILLGIFADWTQNELEMILRLIARQSLEFKVEMEIQGYKFIKLKWKEWDFDEFLLSQRKIGSHINEDCQRDNFMRVLKQDLNNSSHNNNNNSNSNNNNNNSKKHNNTDDYARRPLLGRATVTSNLEEAQAIKQKIQRQQLLQQQIAQQQMQRAAYLPGIMMPNMSRLPRNIPSDFQAYMMNINHHNSQMPYTGQTMITPMVNAYNVLCATGLRLQRPANSTIPFINSPVYNNNNNTVNNKQLAAKSLPSIGYKMNKLTVGNTYDVCVSFVEKGPYLFWVQLMSAQQQLTDMMNLIERVQLQNLTNDELKAGTACIARYFEDGQLYRALVAKAMGNEARVIYVDYGNSEVVKTSDLYEIPSTFMEDRAFAFSFELAGIKSLGSIDDSLKKTFKEMVVYQTCKLKVTPPEGPPVVQYCELYMEDKNILNALQEIQKSRLVYPKASQLMNNDVVEIRFIDSPCNFYVQNIEKIQEFEKLMDDMFLYYNANQLVPPHIAVGAAYAVKTDTDWYRAEVIRADDQAIIVRLVDFGYERTVTKNLLSIIAERHLKMPRQAVHCCLKGFEANEFNNKDLATTQFEMLAEDSNGPRRSFNVKVFRIQPDDLHIVNLFTKELNVMKKLYKLSMPFEQYLTLEKEDFNLNGHGHGMGHGGQSKNKNKDEGGKKTYSTTSSNIGDGQSSVGHQSKKSFKENGHAVVKNVQETTTEQTQQKKAAAAAAAATTTTSNLGQQQQQQQINALSPSKQDGKNILPTSTPAQRLQQYSSKDLNKSSEWEKTSTASSNNTTRHDARSNASDRQKSQSKKENQQHANNNNNNSRKQQKNPDLLNNSFDSTDRRSDVSSNSNRSFVNNNNHRQKDRRNNNKDSGYSQRSPRSQKQQERSQNAPQGYSQSRRGSMDSQYGVEISISKAVSPQPPPSTIPTRPEEYMALDIRFPVDEIAIPKTEEVTICWWVSPHQFFTHRKSRASAFADLMKDIQSFYKNKPLVQLQLKPDSHVIARHRKDNMLYRARIMICNHMLRKYKVNFVDFGSQYTVTSDDIWPVERRFADFPIMAYYCSLRNIVSNYDHLYIIDRMDKYLPNGATLMCDFEERLKNLYYVNINVNNISLLDQLKTDGFVTEISPDTSIELLAGQQIRAKFVSIKNMLNFKILIEGCDVPLLCCHDDVRFVKSNPDIVHKFKQFYEGKSCVVNIKDVNDNKVILLRPLLPLFRDETINYICNYPRIWSSFQASVVFISNAHRLFVHPQAINEKMSKLLDDMYEYYENQGISLSSFESGKICAAKSVADSNWYRARILQPSDENFYEAYFIDYGNTEILETTQFKVLENQFFQDQSAFAFEINLPIRLSSSSKSPSKKSDEQNSLIMEQLRIFLEDKVITVNALECRRNHLVCDVITDEDKNMIDILIEMKLVKCRDVDYMCKQLETDKSNIFEFIETVDLTLDDEDDSNMNQNKKQEKKSQKPASPRKKKNTSNNNNNNNSSSTNNKNNNINSENQKKTIESAKNVEEEPVKEAAEETVQQQQQQQPITQFPTDGDESISKVEPKKLLSTNPFASPEVAAETIPPPPPPAVVEPVAATLEEIIFKEEIIDSVTPESPLPPTSLEDFSEMEQAILSHCDTPAQFFVHKINKVEQLRKLQENLQIVASSFPPLMNVNDGAFCISMYSVDKQWYRAQIIDAELMAIKFIDFGNTDCVSDTIDVKEMSVFPDIEPLCIPCALPIRPNGTADWVDAANAIFNESYSKTLYFNYITQGDFKKASYINLYIDGVNIAKKLIDDGFAKPLELVDSGVNCFISHVNSISDFYIQYEKDSKALELIEIYLSNTEKLEKVTEFQKDKIVAALFHDDGNWYRAKLLEKLPDNQGFEVLFIDYGNMAATKDCREISIDIANLPSLSKKCALDLSLDDFLGWSDAAEEKFAEIAASGETIFNVELRAPAIDHAVVHLYIDNLNINSELEPLCVRRNFNESKLSELNASFGAQSVATIDTSDPSQLYNAIISHSISPECFFVQFEKDSARLEDLTNSLNASVGMDTIRENIQIGELYATVYDEDSKLYRARVLKIYEIEGVMTYTVLFVDFGNEAIVTELRVLPLDLAQLRELCKCCTLKGIEMLKSQLDFDIITEIFHEVIDLSEAVVKLDFEQPQPEKGAAIVNLYTASTNQSIYEQMVIKVQEKKLTEATAQQQQAISSNQCLISHAVTPFELYIQYKGDLEKLEMITGKLRETAKIGFTKFTGEPKLNDLYAVYAEEFGGYYRARLIALHDDDVDAAAKMKYEIKCIDHGEQFMVSELFELPADLMNEPEIAVRCRLSGFTEDFDAKNAMVCQHFAAVIDKYFGELFEIEIVKEKSDDDDDANDDLEVKLMKSGEDIADTIRKAIDDGSVAEVEAVEPTLYDCAIVHINSTDSFYIQLLENTPAIEQITDKLLDAEMGYQAFSDLKIGALCAAQFPDDGVFYRARILKIIEEEEEGGNTEEDKETIAPKCLVHFVDFGNDSITNQFRALPDEILNQPYYSKHCALKTKFKETEAATEHFQAFINEHYSETFQIEFINEKSSDDNEYSEQQPVLCHLFHQTKNVGTEIQTSIKNA